MRGVRAGVVTKSPHHFKPEFERVAANILGNLVDETLDCKQGVIVGNTAYRPDGNGLFNGVLAERTDTLMGHIIPVIRAQNRKGFDISGRRRRGFAIHNRWHHAKIQAKLVKTHPAANDVVGCAGQVVICINKTTHALHRRGARMGKGHIILTGENHFYRHFHFHGGNRTQDQGFHFSALAKSATNQMGVKYNILRIKPGIVGNEHG